MSFQTLDSVELNKTSKRELKGIARAIQSKTSKEIDLRSNRATLIQYIKDNLEMPPLLQLIN